jgi:NTP pyrophosphatase (non-canonical NTP hydrolase)
MNMAEKLINFQHYLKELYQKEKWDEYHAFTNSNFLLEELGELAEECLQPKQASDIIGELGDILQAILAVANHYNVSVSSLSYELKLVTEEWETCFIRFTLSLGLLAREIRRQEIGRHSHEQTENMTTKEKKEKLIHTLTKALHSLDEFCLKLNLSFDDIIEENMKKMKKKYPLS